MSGQFHSYIHSFLAGEEVRFLAPGCHSIAIKSAKNPVDAEFYGEDYRSMGRASGLSVGDSGGPSSDAFFQWVDIKSDTEQEIEFAAYGGSFSVSRIAGSVESSPDISRVKAGDVYGISDFIYPYSAEFSVGQLFNGSDFDIFVPRWTIDSGAERSTVAAWIDRKLISSDFSHYYVERQLVSLSGASESANLLWIAGTVVSNTNVVNLSDRYLGEYGGVYSVRQNGGFIVPAGHGLAVICSIANVEIAACVECFKL